MSQTVLITDTVDPICIELLEEAGIQADVQLSSTPEELQAHAAKADGWIIRSGTRITPDLIEGTERLRVIGRAGVGVDNVDLEAATRRGILVINAPDGNTISTAEHTCAMLLALARRIPPANASLISGMWERKRFKGSEVFEKTLGIIGVGKIGRAVAQRMRAFGMHLVGFDPMLTEEAAERFGVELVTLPEVYARADFITVHTPLNDATRGLLNRETLAQCKPGVRIVNCARGGIVDEEALLEALESGHVAGAAVDVYSQEPPPQVLFKLIKHSKVVATPHIAASTDEAQHKVAQQITEQVIQALRGEAVSTPVNGLAIRMASQRDAQPFLRLAESLGRIAGQLIDGPLERFTIKCAGELPHRYAEVLSVAALKGLLGPWTSDPVNLINAPFLAKEMGLAVDEQRGNTTDSYTNLIEVQLTAASGTRGVAGTIFGNGEPRLVQVDDYRVEIPPEGHLLLYQNIDQPGMLATVGGLLAEANINIAALSLGRRTGRGSMALTVVSVDEPVSEDVRARIAALDGVSGVHAVEV